MSLRVDMDARALLVELNSQIARLTYMTSGGIGRDWRTGREFVLPGKGDEFKVLQEVRDSMRRIREALLSQERNDGEEE